MKKTIKIVGLVILTLVLCVATWYLYTLHSASKFLVTKPPRQPRLEIPVTYNVGWWSNQEALSIHSLQIEIIESRLNMFNSKSLISYKVAGQLSYKGHWIPTIEEVHISERINLDTTLHCDRIIEITPVIEDKKNRWVNGGIDKFEFKNEHTIASNHWGMNRIKFICGQKEQTIELLQHK